MTAYGTRRHLYDPKMQTDKPFDQTTISLQMGTNKGASQVSRAAGDTRTAAPALNLGEPGGEGESQLRAVAESTWQQREGTVQLSFCAAVEEF